MANALIIDDDYCLSMGEYCEERGKAMETMLSAYIAGLQSVQKTAVKSGDVSLALQAYLEYAAKFKGQLNELSSAAKTMAAQFVAAVENEDQFVF